MVTETVTTSYDATVTTLKINGGVHAEESVAYELDTRRVNKVTVKPETATGTVADRAYRYDAVGKIESVTDAPHPHLRRATPGANVVRPHAVTGLTTTRPDQSSTTVGYGYDAAGNMTNRAGQIITWDAEGKAIKVVNGSKTTTNLYDTSGTRLIRRDSGGSTLYLPGQEVRRNVSGSTVTFDGTRYYAFGGRPVASRTTAAQSLAWLFSDHQGTQQIAVNAYSQQVTIRRQTPYGEARGTTAAWPNSKGFVGGDIDPTGLIHVGAREYDQGLGRFISVDPVQDLTDPQQWNAYSYANNDPVSQSDPTGLRPVHMVYGGGGKRLPTRPATLSTYHGGGQFTYHTPVVASAPENYRGRHRAQVLISLMNNFPAFRPVLGPLPRAGGRQPAGRAGSDPSVRRVDLPVGAELALSRVVRECIGRSSAGRRSRSRPVPPTGQPRLTRPSGWRWGLRWLVVRRGLGRTTSWKRFSRIRTMRRVISYANRGLILTV